VIVLREKGCEVLQQYKIRVYFKGKLVGKYHADLLIDRSVIVELKAAEAIHDEHMAQLLNYLRATEIEVGLLLNFGPRPNFVRKIFTNDRKRPSIC
jgi:GxxExxY protein